MKSNEQLIAEFEDFTSRDTSCITLGVAYSDQVLQLQSRGREALPAITRHLKLVTVLDSPLIQTAWKDLLHNIADEIGSDCTPGINESFDSWINWAEKEGECHA